MSAVPSTRQQVSLGRQSGSTLFWGPEAILKGILEAEEPVELIAGPSGHPYAKLFAAAREDVGRELLALHGTRLVETESAPRAVELALQAASSGERALALVPNADLEGSMAVLGGDAGEPGRGALCLLLEDDPVGHPHACPRLAAIGARLTCAEPAGVAGLRNAVQHLLRLARAGHGAAAAIVHHSILRSSDTFEAGPNRVSHPADAAGAPRRGARWSEAGGLLRVVRRLEINSTQSLPSPGERVPVSFIVVGAAQTALDHVIHVLGLHNRVPVLRLGCLNPLDESVVERMLARSRQVVLLEPRPGAMEVGVLRIAQALRERGEHSASVSAHAVGTDPSGRVITLGADDATHPSVLARKIIYLLHAIRPGIDFAAALAVDPPALNAPPPPRGQNLGFEGARQMVRSALADVDQWLHDLATAETAEGGAAPPPVRALSLEGVRPVVSADVLVRVEVWSATGFLQRGVQAVRQAARDERPWLFVVCTLAARDVQDVERLARGAVPGDRAERARIVRVDLHDSTALRDVLRDMAQFDGLGVVVATDGPPVRFDVVSLERSWAEVDRLGYEPRQRVVRTVEEACAIHQDAPSPGQRVWLDQEAAPLKTEVAAKRPSRALRGVFRLRVRPLLEQVEVIRERPPASTVQDGRSGRLGLPSPVHARRPQWRVHLAGFRGGEPGVVGQVLLRAGVAMGYHVRSLCEAAPIGSGRRAWVQLLYTRPRRDGSVLPLVGRVPYGEADLLLGLDAAEALRAIDPDGALRVAGPDRTSSIANLGGFAGEQGTGPAAAEQAQTTAALRAVSRPDVFLTGDFAAACRNAFRTDRVVDLALLGAAFQLGLIPLSIEAIEAAVGEMEQHGVGRAREAFAFGRRLAVDERLFTRPGGEHEDVARAVRRARLASRAGRGRDEAVLFATLLEDAVAAMPGLAETDPGRTALREFVLALRRCLIWGELGYARRYADFVTELYRVDRGETGRALTRNAVLPLAEAMLIRDPIYVSSLATSREERHRVRRLLNVKLARGDRLERRFLTRLELIARQRRVRMDVRTGDWPAWIIASLGNLYPDRWRGSRREREIRKLIVEMIEQATRGAADDYARWAERLQRLHDQAVDDRLRLMAKSELLMLIGEE